MVENIELDPEGPVVFLLPGAGPPAPTVTGYEVPDVIENPVAVLKPPAPPPPP
jgi:hypothetical protein